MISNAAFAQLMQQINLPSAAAEYDRFALYCTQLQEWNQRMNLTAITQPDQVAKLHLLDSLTVLTAADLRGKRIIDVGCGGNSRRGGCRQRRGFPRAAHGAGPSRSPGHLSG